MAVTKAQEIYDEIEKRVAAGTDKADAFKQLAEETGRPYDSVRGSYYSHKKKLEGGEPNARPARTPSSRDDTRRRTSGRSRALERAIDSIDREVEVAKSRADEAKAEYDALKGSATERKKAITERPEALK
jgi:chromosome segregation ATPase